MEIKPRTLYLAFEDDAEPFRRSPEEDTGKGQGLLQGSCYAEAC